MNWVKLCLLTALTVFVSSCSGKDKEADEEFNPQPGGKCCEKKGK